MSSELATVDYSSFSLEERKNYATTLAKAGDMIPKGLWAAGPGQPSQPSEAKVFLVFETGNMLGLHPVAALQGVNVIEGRSTLSAQLMAALIRKAGHKLRISQTGTVETGDIVVTATLIRSDDPDHEITASWTIGRAMRAGLVKSYRQNEHGVWEVRSRSKNDEPLPWEAYTESMLEARVISAVARSGAPDVILGLYTTEEMRDMQDLGELTTEAEPVEPTDDWVARIAETETPADVEELLARIPAAELTDKLRTRALARKGVLQGVKVEAEPLVEDTAAEAVAGEVVVAELVDDEPAPEPVSAPEPPEEPEPAPVVPEPEAVPEPVAEPAPQPVPLDATWPEARKPGAPS